MAINPVANNNTLSYQFASKTLCNCRTQVCHFGSLVTTEKKHAGSFPRRTSGWPQEIAASLTTEAPPHPAPPAGPTPIHRESRSGDPQSEACLGVLLARLPMTEEETDAWEGGAEFLQMKVKE